ncbi:MAG: hypothetical protein D6749_08400 [Chloroflexota bacterium]|nr:MAG: hypothetical protein D6749_08400 [Chloroflexota bacterium]
MIIASHSFLRQKSHSVHSITKNDEKYRAKASWLLKTHECSQREQARGTQNLLTIYVNSDTLKVATHPDF